MNKLVSILVVALLCISAVAVAQNLVFEHGFENHPDAVEILSFSASPTPIYKGEGTTLSWVLKDATSCTTSDGTVAWRALSPGGSSSSFNVTALASAGNYLFTLTCVGPVGEPSVATTNVVVEVPPPVNILSLTATPGTILKGASVTLAWTVEAAIDCTTSGGTAQWRALSLNGSNGSVQITDLNTVGVYQFGLSCEGVGVDNVDTASRQVTVESAPSCPASTLQGQNFLWNDFWQTPNGLSFPRTGLGRVEKPVLSSGYMSIQFNTGNVVNHGQFSLVISSKSGGLRLGALSQCRGRFEAPAKCKQSWGTNGFITWSTDGSPNACELLPNTDYFLNFTYTDGIDPQSSRCDLSISGACWLIVDYQSPR